MIWRDKIKTVYEAIRGTSIYNAARSTTPSNLCLIVLNQAKDWLCMYKPWRDLRKTVELTLDSDRKADVPEDYGCSIMVYSDPSNIGKPQIFYTLNDNDITRRYTEEITQDEETGAITRKLCFPAAIYLPAKLYLTYSMAIADYTAEDVEGETKVSFFPLTVMLCVAKKIFQDYYGVPANQDPNWINMRVAEELRIFEGYAYNNNVALEYSIKDRFGNPVAIPGMALDGRQNRINRPSPYLPSTLYTGGM